MFKAMVSRRIAIVLLVLALSTFFPAAALAQPGLSAPCTTIGGTLLTNTTLTPQASPYCVTSSLEVPRFFVLVIQPGVRLAFYPGTSLQVDGELVARGIPTQPIIFTSAQASPAPGDWNGIYFSPNSRGALYDFNGVYVNGSVIQGCASEFCNQPNEQHS